MNALLPLFTAAGDAADQKAANLLAAARALTPHLNRSRALDRKLVSGVMTTTFGASDAEGAWLWRDAYDAIEAALVLQLRRLSPQIGRLEDAPADIAALLARVQADVPTAEAPEPAPAPEELDVAALIARAQTETVAAPAPAAAPPLCR